MTRRGKIARLRWTWQETWRGGQPDSGQFQISHFRFQRVGERGELPDAVGNCR